MDLRFTESVGANKKKTNKSKDAKKEGGKKMKQTNKVNIRPATSMVVQRDRKMPVVGTDGSSSCAPQTSAELVGELNAVRRRHAQEMEQLMRDLEKDASKEIDQEKVAAEAAIENQKQLDRKEFLKAMKTGKDGKHDWKLRMRDGVDTKKMHARQRKDMEALKDQLKVQMDQLIAKHRAEASAAAKELTAQHRSELQDVNAEHSDEACSLCHKVLDGSAEQGEATVEKCGSCSLTICGDCVNGCDACMECGVIYCPTCVGEDDDSEAPAAAGSGSNFPRCATCAGNGGVVHCCGGELITMPCGALVIGQECAQYHKDVCDCQMRKK